MNVPADAGDVMMRKEEIEQRLEMWKQIKKKSQAQPHRSRCRLEVLDSKIQELEIILA